MNKQYDFLSCTDLHFTSRVPACRKPGYEFQATSKFDSLLRNARKTRFKVLLCAGDFFDSATKNLGFHLLGVLISTITKFSDVSIYVVPGNHDLRFHSVDLEDSPLSLIAAACPNFHVVNHDIVPIDNSILLIGAGWNQSILDVMHSFDPEYYDMFEYQVTLQHVTVFEKRRAAWAGDRDSYLASEYLDTLLEEMSGLDFAITGDNHERFMYSNTTDYIKHVTLVNSGCMMRGKIDLMNYTPKYAAYYRDKNNCNLVDFIPFHIQDDVFNLQYVQEQKEIKAATRINFDDLIEEVNSAVSITLDYSTAIQHVVTSKHPELKEKLNFILNNI